MKDLGQKIKKLRELKNFTQEYMAEQLDMTQSAYSKLENQGDKITYSKLLRISHIYNLKPEHIINFDPAAVFHLSGENYIDLSLSSNPVKEMEFHKTQSEKKDVLIKTLKKKITSLKKTLKNGSFNIIILGIQTLLFAAY